MKISSSITGFNNKFDANKLRIQAWNSEKAEARRFAKFETCLLIRLSAFLSLVPSGGMSVIAIFLIRYNDVTYNADAYIYIILPINLLFAFKSAKHISKSHDLYLLVKAKIKIKI